MNLTMLDQGVAYLQRSQKNRDRLVIQKFALGAAANYTVNTSQLTFYTGLSVFSAPVDAYTVALDTYTATCIVPANTNITFGELGVVAPDGTLLALGVMSNTITTGATDTVLTMVLTYQGLGLQLTLVTDRTPLSYIRPDYEDALVQLTASAITKDNFKGLVTNETGNTLLELMSGVVDFDSAMFESAYQEAFDSTAKLDSSQYAIQTMLSNRLSRKLPASATCALVRATVFTQEIVPAYSSWLCNGVTMFNRQAVILDIGQVSTTAVLYVGTPKQLSLAGQGTDFQFFTSLEQGFTVSDQDVQILISGIPVQVVQDPLWNYKGVPAVQDLTDKNGSLVIGFGNSFIASKPGVTDIVSMTYAITNGSLGNDITLNGKAVTCSINASITGTLVTGTSGGGDQPDISLYKQAGGDIYGGQRGSVTPNQYTAKARQYPGVLDAIVLAQRNLAPYDKNWFNVGKVILLTQSPWSAQNKSDFVDWFQKRTMYSMRYLVVTGDITLNEEPRIKAIQVAYKISCFPEADLGLIKAESVTAVKNMFAPRYGILSRDQFKEDILAAIRSVAPSQIDSIQLLSPTTDQFMDISSPKVSTSVTTGGSIPLGTYSYGVSSYDADGETAPTIVTVTVLTNGSIVGLTWDRKPAAIGYKIYGRQLPVGHLINIPQTFDDTITPIWLDNGSVSGDGSLPQSINTSGVHYAQLAGDPVATVVYSTRRLTGG